MNRILGIKEQINQVMDEMRKIIKSLGPKTSQRLKAMRNLILIVHSLLVSLKYKLGSPAKEAKFHHKSNWDTSPSVVNRIPLLSIFLIALLLF